MPPTPAQPFMGTDSPDAVGGLRIFMDPERLRTRWDRQPDEWIQVERHNVVFREVARWVHFGLCMLESPEGRESLIECGNRTVSGWDRRGQPHNFRNYGRSMRFCVNYYLLIIRQTFPDIYLTSAIRGDGSTHRTTWGVDLRDYDPKVAAIHKLHRLLPEHSLFADYTRNHYMREGNIGAADAAEDEHNCYTFRCSSVISRLCAHAFIGFLSGRDYPDTPPNVQARRSSNSFVGDAGRFWANGFLGSPECVEGPNNVLGWRQAGVPYLVDNDGNCEPISRTWIANFVRGHFDFRPRALISVASRGPERYERPNGLLSRREHIIDVRNREALRDAARHGASGRQDRPRERPTETANDAHRRRPRA